MNQFNFTMPTKFYVGFGQVNVLREVAGEYGKKALLCADSTMGELGFLEKVKNLLKEAGVEVEVIDDVQPNPKDVDIDRKWLISWKKAVTSRWDWEEAVPWIPRRPWRFWRRRTTAL